jgi:SAM-dependent methyltransferase
LPGDEGLLRRCAGPVLDVGCGPGRLTSALTARGHVALGVDISRDAVALARRRGAPALRRDVFAPLPGEGGWARVLLVDGNIGINGAPVRLLRRCRDLAAPYGRILVEVEPPGARTWAGEVRIAADGGVPSAPFPWAYVSVDQLARLARAAGLRVLDHWTEAGRWFADLS